MPSRAGDFLVVRLIAEAGIALTVLALWRRRFGVRWAEPLSLLVVVCLVASIAWMVPRTGDQLEAYLLGLSLPIYATAFLVVWRWPMTVALTGFTGVALTVSALGVRPRPRRPPDRRRPPSTSAPSRP